MRIERDFLLLGAIVALLAVLVISVKCTRI